MIDPAQHQRVKELFLEACQRPLGEQAAFLAAECGGDRALRVQVDELLVAERARPEFLEDSPVPRVAVRPASAMPERIGAFRIVRLLGEGGMGQVFEAEQDDPRRRVALKVLRPGLALPRLLARFEQEKSLLARLQHPGIAQIFDAGTAEIHGLEQPYFAMEFVDGVPLTAHARSRDLPTRARLELFVHVCDAVQHAHQKGVVHRDLKPANILVTADGQPKVLDFGVARATDSDVQLTLATDAAQIVGTLPYMSPEQASGTTEQVDARSDVYGLGVLLYELLTDQLPYDVATTPLPEAVRIICEQEPRRFSMVGRGLRGDLETIAGKALAKDKERRYASADALAADVRRHLCNEPIEARPPSRMYRLAKFARRNRLLVAAIAALFVALLAGLWFATRAALQEGRLRAASERRLYRDAIRAALSNVEAGGVVTAQSLLEATAPELRDWEWRYLIGRLDLGTRQLTGLPDPPLYAGFVHATNQALAIDAHSVAHLWDLTTEQRTEVRFADQAEESTGSHFPIALSGDGSLVLTRSTIRRPEGESTAASLWEPTTGRVVQRFPVDRLGFLNSGASAISPTGTHVALAAEDALYLYEVTGPRLLERFAPAPSACAFSARGEWLAYAAGNSVRFWDVGDNREARDALDVALQPDQTVGELALSPDRSLLATSLAGTIHVLDLETGGLLHDLHGGGNPVYNLVFGSRGSFLLSQSDGAAFRLWNPSTGALVRTFPGYRRYGAAPGFDATGQLLVTAHSDSHVLTGRQENLYGIRIWNLAGNSALVLRGHQSYVYPVAISADGGLIASGSFDGEIRLWDAETGRTLSILKSDRLPIHALAFDLRGARLVSTSRSGRGQAGFLDVWNTSTGELLRRIDVQSTSAAFSPDGSILLVGDGRHRQRLTVLDGSSLERRTVLAAHSSVVAFSADGEFFATGDGGGCGIGVWRTSALEQAFVLQGPSAVTSLDFSPDGSLLASGGDAGKLTVWDLGSRRRLAPVDAHVGEVFAVTFLSARRIASGGRDGAIRIWEASARRTPEEMLELRGHADYVYSLALSPDGERLVSGSGDGTVRIWETQPIARRLAARRAATQQRAPAELLARRLLTEEAGASRALERIDADAGLDPVLRREARYAVLRLTLERAKPK